MRVGDPLEAATALVAPIAAGRWHLVGDGIVLLDSVDMEFDVLRRPATGPDEIIAHFAHHFDKPMNSDAVLYDDAADGIAITPSPGDQLVLRFTAVRASSLGRAFIPNADGRFTRGRIPSLTMP